MDAYVTNTGLMVTFGGQFTLTVIPETPDTETGIISGTLARFSAFATFCGH